MREISEQVKELRNIAEAFFEWEYNRFYDAISRAADTIEALSAKLEAANMERSDRHYGGGWIPCSERLPGEIDGVENGSTWVEFLVAIKSSCDNEGYCTVSRFEEPIQDFWHDDVIAWRPMPEQYRPEPKAGD